MKSDNFTRGNKEESNIEKFYSTKLFGILRTPIFFYTHCKFTKDGLKYVLCYGQT